MYRFGSAIKIFKNFSKKRISAIETSKGINGDRDNYKSGFTESPFFGVPKTGKLDEKLVKIQFLSCQALGLESIITEVFSA